MGPSPMVLLRGPRVFPTSDIVGEPSAPALSPGSRGLCSPGEPAPSLCVNELRLPSRAQHGSCVYTLGTLWPNWKLQT